MMAVPVVCRCCVLYIIQGARAKVVAFEAGSTVELRSCEEVKERAETTESFSAVLVRVTC